jgi:acyl carrier protein
VDQQVKLRGFRIELGEIEAVACSLPEIRECVAMVREDEPGERRLVAYLVPQADVAPNVSKVRQFLRERLPEFMVPGAFVILPRFPAHPNGKIDRAQFPPPAQAGQNRQHIEGAYAPPRTPVEQALCAIWAQVLHAHQVGIYDHFFADLGGHSLLATRLISQVREAFQIELPLRRLFESPTVAELAAFIESDSPEARQQPLEPIRRRAETPQIDVDRLSDEEVDAMLRSIDDQKDAET